jgi:hypothetical protein
MHTGLFSRVKKDQFVYVFEKKREEEEEEEAKLPIIIIFFALK